MKTTFHLFVGSREVTEELFQALADVYPEGLDAERSILSCRLPLSDPRADALLGRIAAHGYTMWRGRKRRQPHEIAARIEQTFDRRDLEAAPAVEFRPHSTYHRLEPRGADGRLIVPTKDFKPKSRLIGGGYDQLIVSADLKQALEAEGFAGLVFRPVVFEGRPRDVARLDGRFEELDTDVILPVLARSMRFSDAVDGHEVSGDGPPPFVIREGWDFPECSHEPAALHYTAAAWAGVAPFDLARTREKPMGDRGYPVASPALYRFFAGLRIAATWVPVRVVNEA